jgi:hypothetical protein
MNFEGINFPVYRKYKNSKSYFKIINARLFEEIQIVGSKRFIRLTEVRQFPEMNFIHDLLFSFTEMADEISEEEYTNVKEKI